MPYFSVHLQFLKNRSNVYPQWYCPFAFIPPILFESQEHAPLIFVGLECVELSLWGVIHFVGVAIFLLVHVTTREEIPGEAFVDTDVDVSTALDDVFVTVFL